MFPHKEVTSLGLAQAHLSAKAKPPGSLGLLETWATKLCVLQNTLKPSVTQGVALIFAADHGVAWEEKVSAYPASITEGMFSALAAGGAAASVLAKSQGVDLEIIDVGVRGDVGHAVNLLSTGASTSIQLCKVANGTKNFCKQPAMTIEECKKALDVGSSVVQSQLSHRPHNNECPTTAILIGELGIGNTATSAALLCAFRGCAPSDAVGRGTGVDDQGLAHKTKVVADALKLHSDVVEALQTVRLRRFPNQCIVEDEDEAIILAALAALGGLEIVAMAGAILEAAKAGAPVLIDGFISATAAVVAVTLCPTCVANLFLATRSPEKGFHIAAAALLQDHDPCSPPANAHPTSSGSAVSFLPDRPLLDIGLRLGEGTGAILAFNFLRAAATLAADMWSLEDVQQSST